MRKTLLLVACAFTLLCTSCNQDPTEKISTTVNSFLTAYFNTDYQTAATFCTEELSAELVKSVEELSTLSDEKREDLKELSSQVRTFINSIELVDKNTYIVHYDLEVPDYPTAVQNTLTVVKIKDKWLVSKL